MASDRLEKYRGMRDFGRTTEPAGSVDARSSKEPIFVVQKHDASTLHYDFRIEMEGVLVSWAVPKGPSTDPSVKRLAIPTEDHPLEYADFEGTIPADEYGGGAVIVWDRGVYENMRAEKDDGQASMQEAYEQGHIEIWLHGEKLRGGYALVRTHKGKDEKWLLIKMKDDEADPDRNITQEMPSSVLSDRTLEDLAAESNGEAG